MSTFLRNAGNCHQGRNIKRFRDMLGIKQEGLAFELGEGWSQKRVSLLEQREMINLDILNRIARIMKVPVEAILNFDERTVLANLTNSGEGIPLSDSSVVREGLPFDPVEKWLAALSENRELYERLLRSEQEKVELLRHLLEKQPS